MQHTFVHTMSFCSAIVHKLAPQLTQFFECYFVSVVVTNDDIISHRWDKYQYTCSVTRPYFAKFPLGVQATILLYALQREHKLH